MIIPSTSPVMPDINSDENGLITIYEKLQKYMPIKGRMTTFTLYSPLKILARSRSSVSKSLFDISSLEYIPESFFPI